MVALSDFIIIWPSLLVNLGLSLEVLLISYDNIIDNDNDNAVLETRVTFWSYNIYVWILLAIDE